MTETSTLTAWATVTVPVDHLERLVELAHQKQRGEPQCACGTIYNPKSSDTIQGQHANHVARAIREAHQGRINLP